MQIFDTHVHVWTDDRRFPLASETAKLPPNDAYPESLLELMAQNSVEWAVLVQHIGYGWDNSYVSQVRKRFPSKFTAICRVRPDDPRAPDQLSYWTEAQGFRGVRISPGPALHGDWFTDSLMVPLFRRAHDLKVPVLILTKPARLNDLSNILDRVPQTSVVLDHMADCFNGSAVDRDRLLSLARYPCLYLKMSYVSIYSTAENLKPDGFLKEVYDAFGASRIMWGSDWPLCLNKAPYSQVISYLREEMDFLISEDLEWIYRKTALQLWPIIDGQTLPDSF